MKTNFVMFPECEVDTVVWGIQMNVATMDILGYLLAYTPMP